MCIRDRSESKCNGNRFQIIERHVRKQPYGSLSYHVQHNYINIHEKKLKENIRIYVFYLIFGRHFILDRNTIKNKVYPIQYGIYPIDLIKIKFIWPWVLV